jgi:predicted metal-dependent hydrolase
MASGERVHVPPRPPDPRRDRKRVAPLPPLFAAVVERFNGGEYRACVEPLEELFFADRNTFYQGLLHLTVALLQLRLGMVRGPRIRLASAAELLGPYAPWHRGVDVAALLQEIEACQARLPPEVVQLSAAEIEQLGLTMPRLSLSPRRAAGDRTRTHAPHG